MKTAVDVISVNQDLEINRLHLLLDTDQKTISELRQALAALVRACQKQGFNDRYPQEMQKAQQVLDKTERRGGNV